MSLPIPVCGRLTRLCPSTPDAYNRNALAGVAELADAMDSKSIGLQGPCGFDSHPRHHAPRASLGCMAAPAFPFSWKTCPAWFRAGVIELREPTRGGGSGEVLSRSWGAASAQGLLLRRARTIARAIRGAGPPDERGSGRATRGGSTPTPGTIRPSTSLRAP